MKNLLLIIKSVFINILTKKINHRKFWLDLVGCWVKTVDSFPFWNPKKPKGIHNGQQQNWKLDSSPPQRKHIFLIISNSQFVKLKSMLHLVLKTKTQ